MSEEDRFWAKARFGLGITALFLLTVGLTLALIGLGAALVPGWNATAVASGSMEPALRRGDVVVFDSSEIVDVEIGNVIVFDTGSGSTIHRIIAINPDGSVITQGDNNRSADSSPVQSDMLSGAGFIVVPWVGMPTLWQSEGDTMALAVFALISMVLLQASTLSWQDDEEVYGRSLSAAELRPAGWWLDRAQMTRRTTLLSNEQRAAFDSTIRTCQTTKPTTS